jgi:L-ascorbate metabolism protein UlaG (beta-lactamase superfamily)
MKKVTAALLGLAAGVVAWGLRDVPGALGGRPGGERVWRSPRHWGGKFHNAVPARPMPVGTDMARELVFGGQQRHPVGDVPLVRASHDVARDGLHLTWYGHASTLVEIDGARILLDPVWSDRCSPSRHVGPKRLHAVPVPLTGIGPIDAVVISHDHYDHLDMDSVKEIADLWPEARFVVPLGVGAHLEKWGVPAERTDELDWHEDTKVAGVRLVATPAQHFSGRGLSRDGTLWASWVLEGETGKVFYSGDTDYFIGFAQVGERYGPFDIALVQVGAYDDGWPTIHMTPEHGVEAAADVRAPVMVPVHWATFNLAFHPWGEPVERVLVEAQRRGVDVVVPRPGERLDVSALPTELTYWWRSVT